MGHFLNVDSHDSSLNDYHALSLKWTQEPIKNETLKKVQIEQNFFVVSIFTEKKALVKLKKL